MIPSSKYIYCSSTNVKTDHNFQLEIIRQKFSSLSDLFASAYAGIPNGYQKLTDMYAPYEHRIDKNQLEYIYSFQHNGYQLDIKLIDSSYYSTDEMHFCVLIWTTLNDTLKERVTVFGDDRFYNKELLRVEQAEQLYPEYWKEHFVTLVDELADLDSRVNNYVKKVKLLTTFLADLSLTQVLLHYDCDTVGFALENNSAFTCSVNADLSALKMLCALKKTENDTLAKIQESGITVSRWGTI